MKIFLIALLSLMTSRIDSIPLDGQCVYIINKGTSKSIHSGEYSQTISKIVIDVFNKGLDEIFCFSLNSDNQTYQIYPFKMQVLSLQMSSTNPSAILQKNFYATNQNFTIELISNTSDYLIRSSNSDKNFTLGYDSVSGDVIQTVYNGLCTQKWIFIPLDFSLLNLNNQCVYMQNSKGLFLDWGNNCKGDKPNFIESPGPSSVTCFTYFSRNAYRIGAKDRNCTLGVPFGNPKDGNIIVRWFIYDSVCTDQCFNIIPTGTYDSNNNPYFNIGTLAGKSIDFLSSIQNLTLLNSSSQNLVLYSAS